MIRFFILVILLKPYLFKIIKHLDIQEIEVEYEEDVGVILCEDSDLEKGNKLFKQDMENLVNDSDIPLFPTLRIKM